MIVEQITFRVRRGAQHEFERHVAEWTALMRRSRGFVTQILMRNANEPTEYRAEVRWVSREYRDRFSAHDDSEARALAERGAAALEGAPTHGLFEVV